MRIAPIDRFAGRCAVSLLLNAETVAGLVLS
jgi:hypothetical protein